MNTTLNKRGFAVLELALVAVVVVGLGLVGYRVYQSNQKGEQASAALYNSTLKSTSGTSSTSAGSAATVTAAVTTPSVPPVSNAASLNQLETVLDSVNPSSSNAADSSQLSSQTSF